MNKITDAKKKYDEIPIPSELNERIHAAISQSPARHNLPGKRNFSLRSPLLSVFASAAAIFLVFTAALNLNTAFARELQDLPVIGTIARVLTFRSYETEEDGVKTSVEIPSLELSAPDAADLSDKINAEIEKFCQQYEEDAARGIAEYKQAFLATGGTEEEWAEHHIEVHISYEIKSQNEDFLSFTIEGGQNWSSAYTQKKYYNINLKTDELVSLPDLLGEDYIRLANESIQSQILQRTAEGASFFPADAGGFTGISDSVNFYISENGNPVIVFDKYEIAPGSEGEITFEIQK